MGAFTIPTVPPTIQHTFWHKLNRFIRYPGKESVPALFDTLVRSPPLIWEWETLQFVRVLRPPHLDADKSPLVRTGEMFYRSRKSAHPKLFLGFALVVSCWNPDFVKRRQSHGSDWMLQNEPRCHHLPRLKGSTLQRGVKGDLFTTQNTCPSTLNSTKHI